MSRKKVPELTNPPEIFYDERESQKYHQNTRINKVQRDISERCLELLEIKSDGNIILDIGCGSGISSMDICDGNVTVGTDISINMLVHNVTNDSVLKSDIGCSWPFQDNSFDYAISCSVIQWLFQSYKNTEIPRKRIKLFFKELNRVVVHGCALQFFATQKETDIFMTEAKLAGFKGGLQVDSEGTKSEKKYLVLFT